MSAVLLFTPGALLGAAIKGGPPNFEEVVIDRHIDQDNYNKLMDRRLTPVFAHANAIAGKENKRALIILPGLGGGAFAGPFKGKIGEHLSRSLQHILEKTVRNYSNISCVYFDPFSECTNTSKKIHGIEYRVRPAVQNPGRAQLSEPRIYQESGDDFSNTKLFKIVAWDHVSFPGNDFFKGTRFTDDGVSAAASNSMERLTGIKGKYADGLYLPPEGNKNWLQVVRSNKIDLIARDNVKIAANNGTYFDLIDFQKTFKI